MSLSCGIVGLPNVGKSTLFNSLSGQCIAETANYPFCTIEKNIARIAVQDPRLITLAKLNQSKKIIPSFIEIVDIAGLISGSAKGEGLGNKFLGYIREVDAIIHLLRCFEDDAIIHVTGNVDPIRDVTLVETELMLADIENLEKCHRLLQKKTRGRDKQAIAKLKQVDAALQLLNASQSIHRNDFIDLQLLSNKPVVYVCNVAEYDAIKGNKFTQQIEKFAYAQGRPYLIISASIEAEIATLTTTEDKYAFLNSLGLHSCGLQKLIQQSNKLLHRHNFFTTGSKETHAWTINIGDNAQTAAGKIHSDFARGFIAAAVIGFDDYVTYGSESAASAAGKMHVEGKEYVVQNGDVMNFRFNV